VTRREKFSKINCAAENQVISMERAHLRRRLTAVLLADVVGYSRLMSIDEEGTHVRLADHVKELIEPKIAESRGRLIRSMGDGLLVEFDSALDAVRCGLAIQGELADRDDGVNRDRRIRLRIGINTGDVIVDERDIYGNSINIAARLEGLAEPGEVYVTRGVRDQLQGYPGLSFEDRGDQRVKNIKTPIRVYRVKRVQEQQRRALPWGLVHMGQLFSQAAFRFSPRVTFLSTVILAVAASIGVGGLPTWRGHPQLSPRASIMVLPFRNSSDDPAEDYFADAVTDDLTTDLSRLSDTLVIARATAFTYKGKAVDARDIGREFGVRYVLEGSIRKVGMKVQTNAQLVDTGSAAHIWADRFDNELTDLSELEDAVTGRIASSLHIQLVKAENRRAIAERAADPDAIDLRLRAMAHLINDFTHENTLAARNSLEESVGRDPHSADAWSQLAFVLVSDFLNGWNDAREKEFARAEEALRNALRIDRSVALAHLADGFIRRVHGDHQGALDAFDLALQLDPNLALACAQKANQLVFLGRAKEAPPLVTKAINISPRDPSIGVFYWVIGRAYFAMKDYDNAIIWLQKSVQRRPTLWFSRAHLISAYALTGRLQEDDAQAALSEYRAKFSNWPLQPRILDYYAKEIPNHHPAFHATLEELYKGLRLAGV
jgi:adenylate cyclase